MLWYLLIAVFIISMIFRRWKLRKFNKLYQQLGNDYIHLPLLGHIHHSFGNDEDRMKAFQKFGRESIARDGISGIWVAHKLYVCVSDPGIAELVNKTCMEKGDIMRFIRFILGNGSIFAPVNIWRPRRKILAPTFSPKNLAQFVEVFARQGQTMVQQLRPAVHRGSFSVWPYITTYTMDSVCETTLGVQVNAQENPNQPFLKAFEKASELIGARLLQPWIYNDIVYKLTSSCRKLTKHRNTMNGFINQVIKSKRNAMKDELNNDTARTDGKQKSLKTFLELLIQSSGGERGYSDLELMEETQVIVLAGTDTSAVATAFTILMLARHQDVQQEVFEEIKEVFGESSRPVMAEDLQRLKYLDAVLKETLRLYPPVPVTVRRVDKDVTLPSGITLVEGCTVLLHIWAANRNPRYWGPDAEHFRPERFLDTPLKHPAQFMTFSCGPRGCLGYQYAIMSAKTTLSTLVRHYRVLPATPVSDTGDTPVRLKFDIMMKDVDNFTIQLENRAEGMI